MDYRTDEQAFHLLWSKYRRVIDIIAIIGYDVDEKGRQILKSAY